MKALMYFTLLLAFISAGCSNESAKIDFIDEATKINRSRIEYKKDANADNYLEYVQKSRELLTQVENMDEVSDWTADDSLRVHLKKAAEGDIKLYESLKDKKTGSMDERYSELTAMSSNLEHDIKIMEILIAETEALKKKEQ